MWIVWCLMAWIGACLVLSMMEAPPGGVEANGVCAKRRQRSSAVQ
jgi:hypothetical protein